MINQTLHIIRSAVYEEVGRLTNYEGIKQGGAEDAGTYDRIRATDSDDAMLDRFWAEAADAVTEQLKPFLVGFDATATSVGYHPELELSSSYDVNLTASITSQLHSFFARYIVSRWYKITNKAEAESYGAEAAGLMNDIMRKIYFKKKPVRRRV